MRHHLHTALTALTAMTAMTAFHAYAGTPPSPGHPVLEYRPVLADYRPYREGELLDWRAANEAVERLGGHMGHARRAVDPAGRRDAADGPAPGAQAGERP